MESKTVIIKDDRYVEIIASLDFKRFTVACFTQAGFWLESERLYTSRLVAEMAANEFLTLLDVPNAAEAQ